MRVIANLLTLSFLAVALWLGLGLWQQLGQPEAALQRARIQPSTAAAGQTDQTDQTGQTQTQPPRRWPPLFGIAVVVEPQPPQPPQAVSAPQPPMPPRPPIESLGYRLQGVVRNGAADWAIVSHPSGDIILHIGDTLGDTLGEEGLAVVAIEAEGLWLLRDGERLLLGFETQVP